MARRLTYLIITCALACAGCGHKPSTDYVPQAGDSIYTAQNVLLTYGQNPRRALQLVDSVRITGHEPDFECDVLRATVYSYGLQQHDSAINLCEPLLRHDSLSTETPEGLNRRAEVLRLLCNAYRAKLDNEQWLRYSTELAEVNRSMGQEVESLRTDAEIGNILTHLGRTDEGLAKLDNAILHLDQTGSIDRLDACIVAMKRKMNVLDEQGRQAEIPAVAHRVLDKLNHFERHQTDYRDDSFRLPVDKVRFDDYIAFYRAQTYAFLANAFVATAVPDSAKHYFRLFEQTDYSRSYGGRKMILPACIALGYYDQAEAVLDLMQQRMEDDTVCADYAAILINRAHIAEGRNNTREACDYWQRYVALSKLLDTQLHESEAQDYAARYHAKEQELLLEQTRAAGFRKNIIISALIVALAIICLFTLYYRYQRHVIAQKNSVLRRQIDDAQAYKARFEDLKATILPKKERSAAEQDMKGLSGEELFEVLAKDIREKGLYRDPMFDRQTVTSRYHLTNTQVGSAFAQGSEYNSIADFLRECRLSYACTLLTTTDLRVNEVATASGYTLPTTFNHDFKSRFGLTPSEYRKQ